MVVIVIKGRFLYNSKCYHINPKYRFGKKCLRNSDYGSESPCCEKKNNYCKTMKKEGEFVSFCEPLENISDLKNGFYCLKR